MALHEHKASPQSEPRARRKGGASKLLSTTTTFFFQNRLTDLSSRRRRRTHVSCAGEYRIKQAVDPPRGALSGSGSITPQQNTHPAATVEPRTFPPLDAPNRDLERSQHRTPTTGEEALRTENGAKMQPGDGLPYTKRVSPPIDSIGTWLIYFLGSIVRA